MSKPKLAFGLNFSKKPGATKPVSSRARPMFDDDDDDDDDDKQGFNNYKKGTATGSARAEEEIGGDFDDDFTSSTSHLDSRKAPKSRREAPKEPPKLNSKSQSSTMFGDLSSSLTSRKNAETAAELDANVYEYDSIYDSMKPKKTRTKEDEERKPKYMTSLLQAASVRKRDLLIAEEKKIAREREAEGDEYAGKEKFVTEAYKKQQEENRRAEEEERRREEDEAKKNKSGGMTAFYKKLLEKDEQRHAETLKAADDMAKDGGTRLAQEEQEGEQVDHANEEQDKAKEEARLAQELNEKGASIAINEDGQVVDKRQLLKGGLNIGAKKKEAVEREAAQLGAERDRREISGSNAMRHDKKQAMRERQSRMLEEQLEQSLKRSRLDEEAKRDEVERAAKTRKTEGEISSAKERYLARKKAAEEEKRKAAAKQ